MFLNFKKTYHNVKPCPHCNSYQTGYIVRLMRQEECDRFRYQALLNGELTETELGVDFGDIDNNLFCLNCGLRWHGDIEILHLTAEEIEKQKELRGIDEELITKYSVFELNTFQRRQVVKQLRKQREKIEKKKAKEKENRVKKQTKKKSKEIRIKK